MTMDRKFVGIPVTLRATSPKATPSLVPFNIVLG